MGAVGRHITQSTVNTMTGHTSNPISRKIYESSLNKGRSLCKQYHSCDCPGQYEYDRQYAGEQAAKARLLLQWVMSEKRMHQSFFRR